MTTTSEAGAGTGGTTALDARELYRFFRTGEEETLALRGVSLHVQCGETVAVVGPSGSGKSTLLACLAGLDEPAGGYVHIGRERISHRPEAQRARPRARRIGVLLQSGNLIAHLDLRNIRLAQAAAGRAVALRPISPPCSTGWACAAGPTPCRMSWQAANWPVRGLPSPWPTTPMRSSPTSPPASWTDGPNGACSTCSRAGPTPVAAFWSSPTTPRSSPSPTGCSCCATEGSGLARSGPPRHGP